MFLTVRLCYNTRQNGFHGNTKKKYFHTVLCRCRFLLSTDLTSWQNRKASNIGNKHRSDMSVGSLNHDFIGIALSVKNKKQMYIECYESRDRFLSLVSKSRWRYCFFQQPNNRFEFTLTDNFQHKSQSAYIENIPWRDQMKNVWSTNKMLIHN